MSGWRHFIDDVEVTHAPDGRFKIRVDLPGHELHGQIVEVSMEEFHVATVEVCQRIREREYREMEVVHMAETKIEPDSDACDPPVIVEGKD